jgi:hypothetical protein
MCLIYESGPKKCICGENLLTSFQNEIHRCKQRGIIDNLTDFAARSGESTLRELNKVKANKTPYPASIAVTIAPFHNAQPISNFPIDL